MNQVKQIFELSIGDKVMTQLGNPDDHKGYYPCQELEVTRIHKTSAGWAFLGQWTTPEGSIQLCDTKINHYGADATAPYLCLRAMSYGGDKKNTRREALEVLGFSPDY